MPRAEGIVHKAHGVVQLRAARSFLLQKRLPAALGFLPQCRQIVCIVQQRVKPCCKVPLPRLLAGRQHTQLLSQLHRLFTPGEILLCRAKRVCFLLQGRHEALQTAAKRRALPVVFQRLPDGMQQKFDRCQPPVERQLLQLRCAAALPAGQNRRKRQLFPPAGIEPEERFKRRGNLRMLQKFPEQRAGYRRAQPLVAAKRLG